MSRRNFIIGSTINDLTRDLLYWWDLDAGGATITDQHSGLVLTREVEGSGSGTTDVGTAPDGGDCILFGPTTADRSRFINASVPKPTAYNTAFTVNIWARDVAINTVGNWRINHRDSIAGTGIQYWHISRSAFSGNNNHTIWQDGGLNPNTNVGHVAPALNTWMMYTFVRRGNTLEQWQDGVLVASTSFGAGTMDTGNAPYAIGANAWATVGSQVSHLGQLWCAGQWNRALSAAEIQALYNGGTGRKYAAL